MRRCRRKTGYAIFACALAAAFVLAGGRGAALEHVGNYRKVFVKIEDELTQSVASTLSAEDEAAELARIRADGFDWIVAGSEKGITRNRSWLFPLWYRNRDSARRIDSLHSPLLLSGHTKAGAVSSGYSLPLLASVWGDASPDERELYSYWSTAGTCLVVRRFLDNQSVTVIEYGGGALLRYEKFSNDAGMEMNFLDLRKRNYYPPCFETDSAIAHFGLFDPCLTWQSAGKGELRRFELLPAVVFRETAEETTLSFPLALTRFRSTRRGAYLDFKPEILLQKMWPVHTYDETARRGTFLAFGKYALDNPARKTVGIPLLYERNWGVNDGTEYADVSVGPYGLFCTSRRMTRGDDFVRAKSVLWLLGVSEERQVGGRRSGWEMFLPLYVRKEEAGAVATFWMLPVPFTTLSDTDGTRLTSLVGVSLAKKPPVSDTSAAESAPSAQTAD